MIYLIIRVFIFLNVISAIIGVIWLAFMGEWELIGIVIIAGLTLHWPLSYLLLFNSFISSIAIGYYETNNYFGYVLGFISLFYTNLLIVSTCAFAYFVCSSFYSGNIGLSFIPYLLCAWGMALGPWRYFKSQEPDNEFSSLFLLCASVLFLLFLISIFISPLFKSLMVIIFPFMQLIALPVFSMYLSSRMER